MFCGSLQEDLGAMDEFIRNRPSFGGVVASKAMNCSPKRVVLIASMGRSLVNFRYELLKSLVANGHEVCVLSPNIDESTRTRLDGIGVKSCEIHMNRNGTSIIEDFFTFFTILRELQRFRTDVILPYTMKPIIFGLIAARLAGVSERYALFTGLGYAFSEENPSGRRRLLRFVAIKLYWLALRGVDRIFVFNSAEEADLRRFKLAPLTSPIIQVPGSGIDLDHFNFVPLPQGRITFLMISRLLKSKGVNTFVEAARILREKGVEADLRLLGPLDTNPDSYSRNDLEALQVEGLVKYLGETHDVRPFITAASVIVLPAIHREGMPRAVLEGMSMGRPAITTDVPGCAESVIDGESGFIIPSGDSHALAATMQRFLDQPDLAEKMGLAARKRAEDIFDVHLVNKTLLENMDLLTGAA
jgi:glycosyltransferase involved in cell wall biosynthesis